MQVIVTNIKFVVAIKSSLKQKGLVLPKLTNSREKIEGWLQFGYKYKQKTPATQCLQGF